MTDRSVEGLRACISSLDKVITPAIQASGDVLACEQVQLLSKYLSFLAERIPLTVWRSTVELEVAVGQAEQVVAVLPEDDGLAEATAHVLTQVDAARRLLQAAGTTGAEMEEATAALRTAVSLVVRLLGSLGLREAQREVRSVVVHTSRPYVDLQRGWFAPQNWEDDAGQVPDLEALRIGRAEA